MILSKIPSIFKNKYLLAVLAFAVWMLFFDERDVFTTYIKQPNELKKLQQSSQFYQNEITATKSELDQLKSNPAAIEKYAREKYLMKKDNEDLFLIREK